MESRRSAVKASAEATDSGPTSRRPYTFYYDGECGFCTRVVRLLSAADLRRRVRWVAFQSLDVLPGDLTPGDLRREAYIQQGDVLEGGFYSFRRLTLLLPLLWPLASLIWFPGAHRPGEAAYAWIARNRTRLPGSVCRIDG